jgi:c-di-GMP-binding flagellar brake protein YcgR
MHAKEAAHNPEAMQLERRKYIRHTVDEEAAVQLVSSGDRLVCRVVDIGLTGCRIRAAERLHAAAKARVEVSIRLQGVAFRFSGEMLWNDGQHLAGIQLHDLPTRRLAEFAELLCELQASHSLHAKKPEQPKVLAAAPKPVPVAPGLAAPATPAPQAAPVLAAPSRSGPLGPATPQYQAPKPAAPPREAAPIAAVPGAQAGIERRKQARHDVDTSATILLVNVAARLKGRIINLSLGGCRIRTDERFPVGIYTRVETEFNLEGLPFRLGGVVQAILDKDMVGIRFLDLSERKREQVSQLISEIDEMEARKKLDEAGVAGPGAEAPTVEGGSI